MITLLKGETILTATNIDGIEWRYEHSRANIRCSKCNQPLIIYSDVSDYDAHEKLMNFLENHICIPVENTRRK